jgi:hypothetical protein
MRAAALAFGVAQATVLHWVITFANASREADAAINRDAENVLHLT